LARYAQTLLCSAKSGFTTMVNKRELHIVSIFCFLHRHAPASKVLPEYLKIVLKHVTERVTLSRHGLVFSKCFIKMNWLIFNAKQHFIANSHLATVTLLNFGVAWAKSFQLCRSVHLKLLYLFQLQYLSAWGRVLLYDNHKT